MNIELIIFSIFSALVLASAIGVVVVNNPVKSAINLVFTFFSSAVLWMLLNAEFFQLFSSWCMLEPLWCFFFLW